MPIHSVAMMLSFSFLYLLHYPINHQPFTMDNGLNTWARLLYVIHEQPFCFPAWVKNTLHHPYIRTLSKRHVMPIHSVAMMLSFSFLYLLHYPINHQPFTMDNGLNTWACLLYFINKQSLCFPARDKNTLHISEMLRLQKAQKCNNVQSTFHSTIHWNFPNIVQMRKR
jgi:hypothetical protein